MPGLCKLYWLTADIHKTTTKPEKTLEDIQSLITEVNINELCSTASLRKYVILKINGKVLQIVQLLYF